MVVVVRPAEDKRGMGFEHCIFFYDILPTSDQMVVV